ncbi:hypothetical protein CR513_60723, partial [Mucuna pruriens]
MPTSVWHCLKPCTIGDIGSLMLVSRKFKIGELLKAKKKNHIKALEFEIGDHVFLRFTSMTRVGCVIKSRKLSFKFLGSCQILSRVDPLTYEIALPSFQTFIMFHVFHLRKLKKLKAKDIILVRMVWNKETRDST